MRKITLFVLSLVLALGVFSGLLAQTVLISPTGDGGFETGTTFASNGWTEVNATGNNYQIGTAPGGYSGARCGFISNSATTWANTNALAYRHLYRNVTFPANQTEITLTLIYKTNVAQATATDGFTVRMVPTTTTPVTTGYPTGNLIYPGLLYSTTANTWYVISISVPASYAGTTSRLVLSWYNDNAKPRTLGAVDDIELTSKVPDTISSLPYTTTMDPVYYPVSLPSGWSHLMSTAYRPWRIATSTTIGYHSEPYFAIVSYSTTAAKNEWMISPPVSVVSGTDYIIKYWVKAPGYGGVPEKLKVHWGTAPTVASLTANTAIYDDPNMLIADWTEVVINYTATTTGNIYFGWHAYSALDIDYIAVDDITITRATPTMSISENSWDYGLAFVNDSSCTTRQFTATNTGGGTVTIASGGVTLTGRDAAHFDLTDANSYPINLTAGQSASWTVKFDPTSAGEKQAYLNIVDNTGAKLVFESPADASNAGAVALKANSFGAVQPTGSPKSGIDLTANAGTWKPEPNQDEKGKAKREYTSEAIPEAVTNLDGKEAPPRMVGETIGSDLQDFSWSRGTTNISLRGFGVEEVYEDYFDTYTDFTLSFSPWTQDDNDGSTTYSITDVTFTNQGYTGSYIIFNPASTTPALTGAWQAYSGSKYAACFDATTPPNDDWLISPQMTFGKYPRISFFAKSVTDQYGLERFKVLYSTDATTWYYLAGDATTYIEAPVDWTVFEYPVPGLSSTSGYIAIQCLSNDAFVFMVDDFVAGSTDYVYAVQGGYWSDPNTWSTGVVPDSADDVLIPDGVTVIVDSDRVTYSPTYDGLYDYENQANAGSLTVEDGGELILDSQAVLLVVGDVDNSGTITWNAGYSDDSGYDTLLFVEGDFTNNSSGTINLSADYTSLYFTGDAAQTFTNNGSVTGLIYSLEIENTYGVTLAGSNQIPVRRVNLFTGLVTNASQLTLGSSGTSAIVQIGNTEQDNPAGSFDEIPTYAEGCYIQLLYASGNTDYSTGYEVPADGSIDFMLVYMNSGTQYDLTLSQDIYISGAYDSDEMEDEVLFLTGRLYFNGYALVYNAESFYISGQGDDYVDDFAVEIDEATQYDVDGAGDGYTFLTTWETYGTQSGGVDLSFYNPTEWTTAVPTVDAYYSDDGGTTWTLYQADATVTNGLVTLTGVTALGSTTTPRIWAFYNEEEPLPIELSSFTASISATNFVNLTWITQSETGVAGYYILRNIQDDLANAVTISQLIPATNTSQQQTYVYTDDELYEDGTYYYWLQNSDLDGTVAFHGPISIAYTITGGNIPSIPLVTELKPIYPNPFNPRAHIPFSLKESATVNIEIYNTRGQLVRRIPIGDKAAGHYQTEWDGRDDLGRACSTGVYHIRMTAGTESFFRKAVLMK